MQPELRITVLDRITAAFALFLKFCLLSTSLYKYRQTSAHACTHTHLFGVHFFILQLTLEGNKKLRLIYLTSSSLFHYPVILNVKHKIFATKPVSIIKIFNLDKLLLLIFSRKSLKSFYLYGIIFKLLGREVEFYSEKQHKI